MRDDIARHFGQRLRVALAASGHNGTDLARTAGVSRQAVQKWLDGTCYPASSNLIAATKLTGCSAEWLLWPHPVDIRSTPYAPDGRHIKDIVREVLAEERTA